MVSAYVGNVCAPIARHQKKSDAAKVTTADTVQAASLTLLPNKKFDDFLWTSSPTPHAVRRRAILKVYPEIESLYGSDPMQAVMAAITVIVQLILAYVVGKIDIPRWGFILVTYAVSATLNHSLFAAMHEGSHRTIFTGKLASEFFCICTTIPMGLPAAIPFKRYHLDHHIYQGVEGLDPDIPSRIEARLFKSIFGKFLWILLLPLTYSLRPMLTRPKSVVVMDILNWIICVTTDICIFYFWGRRSLLYLLLGTFFSMNFHPFAGHFISEHFLFPGVDAYQETNSYYGLWNKLTYNVGHHNEHHDFPRIPGSKLPLVKKMAPEFYAMTPHYGWGRITWAFILTPAVTPYNRVFRVSARGGDVPKEHLPTKLHEGEYPYGGKNTFWPKIDNGKIS